MNIPRLTMTRDEGGDGLDAQWNDDFHYALHARLTGEHESHYCDFGTPGQITKALAEGFVLTGQFSNYRARTHGESSHRTPAERLLVFLQNHDQAGNRPGGERIGHLVDLERRKLAAAVLLLSPYVPLLFMGEEYDETAPFLFFTDHADRGLNENVRRGRRADFARCGWRGQDFDPADPATFLKSRLNRHLRGDGRHAVLLDWYRELIRLRKELPALRQLSKMQMEVVPLEHHEVIVMRRWSVDPLPRDEIAAVYNLSPKDRPVEFHLAAGRWQKILDSAAERWQGLGETAPGEVSIDGRMSSALSALVGRALASPFLRVNCRYPFGARWMYGREPLRSRGLRSGWRLLSSNRSSAGIGSRTRNRSTVRQTQCRLVLATSIARPSQTSFKKRSSCSSATCRTHLANL